MEQYKLGEMEEKFAKLIWENSPIKTKDLISLCEKEFNWKRTTTYTMLKRLCERNLFENKNGVVNTLTTQENFKLAQSENFLNENFSGSLPMFLTLFSKNKKISQDELSQIQKLIDDYREENND